MSFDGLTSAILLVEIDGTVNYVNSAAQTVLATSAERVHALRAHDLLGIGAPLQAALAATGDNRSITLRELTLKQSIGGQSLVVDCTVSPFGWDGDRKLALVELIRIDSLSRFTADTPSQERHAVTTMLIDRLAHEIKNPLGGIRGAAQLLAQEAASGELTDYTNVIIEEVDRLRNLVDRLVGSRKPLELKETNIHEVLEHVRSLVKAEVSGNSIKIGYDYDPSIPAIIADPEQLIQSMLKIVRNARQSLDSPEIDHERLKNPYPPKYKYNVSTFFLDIYIEQQKTPKNNIEQQRTTKKNNEQHRTTSDNKNQAKSQAKSRGQKQKAKPKAEDRSKKPSQKPKAKPKDEDRNAHICLRTTKEMSSIHSRRCLRQRRSTSSVRHET